MSETDSITWKCSIKKREEIQLWNDICNNNGKRSTNIHYFDLEMNGKMCVCSEIGNIKSSKAFSLRSDHRTHSQSKCFIQNPIDEVELQALKTNDVGLLISLHWICSRSYRIFDKQHEKEKQTQETVVHLFGSCYSGTRIESDNLDPVLTFDVYFFKLSSTLLFLMLKFALVCSFIGAYLFHFAVLCGTRQII